MWESPFASKDIAIPLVTGLIGAVAGGWATIFFQRKTERERRSENVLFDIYMMLMELKGHHFWIRSAELQRRESDPRVLSNFEKTRWRIADEMRKIDHLPEARDILRAMFLLTYPSEGERAAELDRLVETLGKRVNPRYDAVMAEITRANQRLMTSNMNEFFRNQRKIQPTFPPSGKTSTDDSDD